jgi:hypothetical protein
LLKLHFTLSNRGHESSPRPFGTAT